MDREQHHENLAIIHTCFFNRVHHKDFNHLIPALNRTEGDGIKPYLEMLIDNLVYGDEDIYNLAIELLGILIKYSTIDNL